MKQKFTEFFQKNGFYVLAAVCIIALAAVIAVVSTDTNENTNQMAENAAGFSDGETEVESTETNAADEAASNGALGTNTSDDQALDYTEGYNADEIQDIITQIEESEAAASANASGSGTSADSAETSASENTDTEESASESSTTEAASTGTAPSYDGSAKMTWPVQGDILMDYSMENTTYFKTLDQYKCNEGMMIAAAVNTPVNCACDGVVESIYGDDEYGTCVVVNMGNDYKAVYGQVKDVAVTEGQSVTAGQPLAYVAEPSRYFTEEGSHLYFKITQDGLPMNPHNYLD